MQLKKNLLPPIASELLVNRNCQFCAFDLIDAILQGRGAPAQHHVLAACCQLVQGQVYDGEAVYTL